MQLQLVVELHDVTGGLVCNCRRSVRGIVPGSHRLDGVEEQRRAQRPAPNTVPYNDWRRLPVAAPDAFEPTEPVTVVIPYFEAPGRLAALLAGLERQTYPRRLFQVVVVDDGSQFPLRRPASSLEVRVVRQERRGFGLARARNNGARAATHDILVFLDNDMIPDAGLLAAHARWHHAVADALTFGFRNVAPARVDAEAVRRHAGPLRDLLGAEECSSWRDPLLMQTADLTSRHDFPFDAVLGFNFAMRRRFYDAVGGSDGTFARYGGEDTELAYRAYVRGGVIVPVRDARAWHQDGPPRQDPRKNEQLLAQRPKMANLIAHPRHRMRSVGGGIFRVPEHVVSVTPAGRSGKDVATSIMPLLADALDDVAVRIEGGDLSDADRQWLDEFFVADPRVSVAPALDALLEFPASPFHIALSAGAAAVPGIVRHLRRHLGAAVVATGDWPSGERATAARAWALHRARRTGLPPQAFGAAVSAPPPKRRLREATRPSSAALRQLGRLRKGNARFPLLASVAARAGHVRGPRSAVIFARWLLWRTGIKLRHLANRRK